MKWRFAFIPVALCVIAALSFWLRLNWSKWRPFDLEGSIIEFPHKLNFGDCEIGEVRTRRFTIVNRGGSKLLIHNIRTNCSCSGLEREENGSFIRFKKLSLQPNSQMELVVRLSITASVGGPKKTYVFFQTNDPEHPEARIEIYVSRVKGGLLTSPTTVLFGTVLAGENTRRVVDIFDDRTTIRSVVKVSSSNPDIVTARLLSMSSNSEGNFDKQAKATLVGQMEVVLHAKNLGEVHEFVSITPSDDKVKRVAVNARIARPVEVYPSTLVLPRLSRKGPLDYGDCLCRSCNGKPLELKILPAPPGIRVRVTPSLNSSSVKKIRIQCDPHKIKSPRSVVRIEASAGERTTVLTIPVEYRPKHGGNS